MKLPRYSVKFSDSIPWKPSGASETRREGDFAFGLDLGHRGL
jgi:hypothetical protein